MSYSLIAPLCMLFLIQLSVPFFILPLTGFLFSSLIQSMIQPNSRYMIANGILGASAWAVSYLVSSWVIRNLYPLKDESRQMNHSTEQHLSKVSMPNTKDVSVSDLLMDRGHTGFYLTLDTVLGPGLSTRRGYSMFGGGADCGAPPRTIMTFPDYIPQIPCQSNSK